MPCWFFFKGVTANKFFNFIFPLSYVGKWSSSWKSRKSTRICVINLFDRILYSTFLCSKGDMIVLDFLKVKEASFERAEGSLGDLGSKKSKLSQRESKDCWRVADSLARQPCPPDPGEGKDREWLSVMAVCFLCLGPVAEWADCLTKAGGFKDKYTTGKKGQEHWEYLQGGAYCGGQKGGSGYTIRKMEAWWWMPWRAPWSKTFCSGWTRGSGLERQQLWSENKRLSVEILEETLLLITIRSRI